MRVVMHPHGDRMSRKERHTSTVLPTLANAPRGHGHAPDGRPDEPDPLTGKWGPRRARGSEPWPVLRGQVCAAWCGSGCLGQGDGVAEGFELADVAACLALGAGAAGVVGGAEFAEPGGGIG